MVLLMAAASATLVASASIARRPLDSKSEEVGFQVHKEGNGYQTSNQYTGRGHLFLPLPNRNESAAITQNSRTPRPSLLGSSPPSSPRESDFLSPRQRNDGDSTSNHLRGVRSPRPKLSPISALELAKDFPELLTPTSAITGSIHPLKLMALMSHTDRLAMRCFLRMAPPKVVCSFFVHLLDNSTETELKKVFAPIINDTRLHATLVALLEQNLLTPPCVVKILRHCPFTNIAAFLKVPPATIVPFMSSLEPTKLESIVIYWLKIRGSFVTRVLAPFVAQVRKPELLGPLVMNFDPEFIKALMSTGMAAVAFINTMEAADLEPTTCIMQLMHHAEVHNDFLQNMLLPLIIHGDPSRCLALLRKVKVNRILPLMSDLKVDELLRLLENTNTRVLVGIVNSRLGNAREVLSPMASVTARATGTQLGAAALRRLSNILAASCLFLCCST